jgi:acyl-CoA synthetase (AMP-forming)/AMP-acid ligase II
MAEASLAVAFTELNEGVKTLSVHGPTLWAENLAKPVADDDEDAVRLVSCGHAFPEHHIAIFEPDDATSATPLPEHRVGEIRISGPSVMKGYWEDAERTRDSFAGGMLKTGDLGFLDGGHLFICGRSKEVVIVNGRNYYPQDMEWEAAKVPGVRKGNVIAFGARDPSGIVRDRERVVVAFEAQDAEDAEKSAALCVGVRRAVQEGMGLTLDDVVAVVPGALPKTSSGKLQRAKTRELYEAGELAARSGARELGTRGKIDLAKQAAVSQLQYFKLAVLGGRRKKD